MTRIRPLLILTILVFVVMATHGQVRYYFENTSFLNAQSYGDDEIYLNFQLASHNTTPAGAAATYDINSQSVVVIQGTPNTLLGPDGNYYQDINIRLDELPIDPGTGQYYIDMPPVFGSRLYVGFGAPVYRGYGNPLLETQGNPNYFTKVETIEFTINQDGTIFTNTSRVDRYAYPMGEELYCGGQLDSKVGETLTHEQVIAKWKLFVNDEFQNSYDPIRDIIMQMGHTPYFHHGPGADYFEAFFDELWAYASTHTMTAYFDGQNHTITASGNTLWIGGEAFERDQMHLEDFSGGAGQFIGNRIRMAFGVSINRGVITLTEDVQNWEDEQFYWENPIKNDYTNFFHSDFVSHEGQTYALAFDDVFDHSSTQACGNPDHVIVYLGGFGTEHTQVLSDVYITPLDLEVDQFKTLQLTENGLDQGQVDMDIPDDATITWTLLDPNGDPTNDLIDENGLFGPTDVTGDYQVTLLVETTDGGSFTTTETLTVNDAGTTAEVCTGQINGNMDYELQVIGTSTYLTLVTGPTWNNAAGFNRLFYGPNPVLGEMGANTITPDLPFKLEGMYFGDEVYFQIHTEHNGSTGDFIHIPNLGTCDGLDVAEVIINLDTEAAVTIADDETYTIVVDGITNQANTVTYPDDLFTETLVFTGDGVDQNGLFTPDGAGEYIITITYDDIVVRTVITVTGDNCTADIGLGNDRTVCSSEDLSIELPTSDTYSDIAWSGDGSVHLDDLTASTVVFNTAVEGDYQLDVTATDGSGCVASGSVMVSVQQGGGGAYEVELMASINGICPNDQIEFSATLDNAATDPVYSWVVAGSNLSLDQGELTIDTLTKSTDVIVLVNYNTVCGTGQASDTVTVLVSDPATPSVALVLDADKCVGEELTATATPTNGGPTPIYEWEIGGVLIGETGASWSTDTLSDGTAVTVRMASSLTCADGTQGVATENVTLGQGVDPQASLEVLPTTICPGETIQAEVIFGGATPAGATYQWRVNGGVVDGDNATLSIDTLTVESIIALNLSYDSGCGIQNEEYQYVISVESSVVPSVELHLMDGVCAGEQITIQATNLQGVNTPEFAWSVNGQVNSETNQIWTSTSLSDGDEISVVMTTDVACATQPTATATGTVSLQAALVPTLSWGVISDSLCPGETLTMEVNATNAGTNPTYSWTLAGNTVGGNTNTLSGTSISFSSDITVTIIPDQACATPDQLTIDTTVFVHPEPQPEISVSASATEVCEGDLVNVQVDSHAGLGNSPEFSWTINADVLSEVGVSIDLTVSEISVVNVSSNSAGECVQSGTVSDEVTITVSAMKTPQLNDLSTTMEVCLGTTNVVGFPGGTDLDGGVITWLLNGAEASTDQHFSSTTLSDGDVISLQVETDHTCQTNSLLLSNELVISAMDCTLPDTVIAPNTITPNGDGINDTWEIQNLDDFANHNVMIFSRNGRLVYESTEYHHDWNGEWQQANKDLPETTYYFIIEVPDLETQFKGTLTVLRE